MSVPRLSAAEEQAVSAVARPVAIVADICECPEYQQIFVINVKLSDLGNQIAIVERFEVPVG